MGLPKADTDPDPARLKKWEDFLDFCNKHAKASRWFRGVSDTSYSLIPKIGRTHQQVAHGWNETVIFGSRGISTKLPPNLGLI
jgi:hypothetical protein